MRGRPEAGADRPGSERNTPAYAGKTLLTNQTPLIIRKHPRVCGEDDSSGCLRNPCQETPPRMRGRLYVQHTDAVIPGNTPAYAGKTAESEAQSSAARKHPRVCGEDSVRVAIILFNTETPPRMRGRQNWSESGKYTTRNTPAYAGKTGFFN